MAHLSDGIYGTLSGAIGPVVCCVWKGKPYFRAYPAHFRDRKSEAQLAHRRKWQLCHKLVQQMLPLVRVGYAAFTQNQTAYNACMSQCVRQATRVHNGVVEVNFAKVVLGEGPLAVAQGVKVQQSGAALRISWQPNTFTGNASPTDSLMFGVYNSRYEQASIFMHYAKRADGVLQVSLPAHWMPTDVHCFLGFRSENETLCSNIVYAGEVDEVELLSTIDDNEPNVKQAVQAPQLSVMPIGIATSSLTLETAQRVGSLSHPKVYTNRLLQCMPLKGGCQLPWQYYKDGLRRGALP